MKSAMTPLLEFSTVFAVLVVCVIAVVPGAGKYSMALIGQRPATTPAVNAATSKEARDQNPAPGRTKLSGAYASYDRHDGVSSPQPERLAGRNPMTLSSTNTTLVTHSDVGRLGTDDVMPEKDELTMTKETTNELDATSLENEIEFLEQESRPVFISTTENLELTSTQAKLIVDESETNLTQPSPQESVGADWENPNSEGNKLFGAMANNVQQEGDLPLIKQPQEYGPAENPLVPSNNAGKFDEIIAPDENLPTGEFAWPKVINNELAFMQNRNFSIDKLVGAEKSGALIRNQFMSDSVARPADNEPKGAIPSNERQDSDWKMVELPAFESSSDSSRPSVPASIESAAAVERQPMSAASMQGDSQFQAH